MSRVFSLLGFCGPRLGFGGGRGPGLIVAVSKETPGLASFVAVLLFAARTRKKALSSIHRAQLKWDLAPLPANAQLRLPVSAFLALFLLTWCLLELPCSGHASL